VYHAVLMKWLILILLGWLIWRLLRPGRSVPPRAARSRGGEAMRACAQCGLNVPDSEAIRDGDLAYCSDAHLRLGPVRKP
jgi:uncharacterized protein